MLVLEETIPLAITNDHTIRLLGSSLEVSFHRTLRIPNDGKTYPLPCSLGRFPIKRVEDYAKTVPSEWLKSGGVFIPLYQSEAMWIQFKYSNSFHAMPQNQSAVKNKDLPLSIQVGSGMVNVLTGEQWEQVDFGKNMKQNYMVLPTQLWIDGIASDETTVKQFVATPLGRGNTVEEQLTGNANYGGIQLRMYKARSDALSHLPMYRDYGESMIVFVKTLTGKLITIRTDSEETIEEIKEGISIIEEVPINQQRLIFKGITLEDERPLKYYNIPNEGTIELALRLRGGREEVVEMGLGVGGRISQKIYKDPFGVNFWDLTACGKCFVHIVNSEMWKNITGEDIPPTPISKETYIKRNYPWFSLYDEGVESCQVSTKLSNLTKFVKK